MSTRFWKVLIAVYALLGPLSLWSAHRADLGGWWLTAEAAVWAGTYAICIKGLRVSQRHNGRNHYQRDL